MSEETSPNISNNSWFAGLDFKTIGIVAVLSSVLGIGGGAGLVATKGIQAAGMNQDQADIRYLSKEEAQRLIRQREIQMEALESRLKTEIDKGLKKETFDIWQRTWDERQKYFDQKLDRILEK